MWTDHRKEIRKLTFRALALRRIKSYLEYSECGLQSPSEPAVLTECGISPQDSDPSKAKWNQTIILQENKLVVVPIHPQNSKLENGNNNKHSVIKDFNTANDMHGMN